MVTLLIIGLIVALYVCETQQQELIRLRRELHSHRFHAVTKNIVK